MEMGGSSSSSDSHLLKIGLKFGQKTYFEDDEPKSEVGLLSSSSPSPAPKKVRTVSGSGSSSGSQLPRCQVEGCNLDLSDAKTYYSRHKVCGAHSKTAKVVVNGLEQRFCQQCSRYVIKNKTKKYYFIFSVCFSLCNILIVYSLV